MDEGAKMARLETSSELVVQRPRCEVEARSVPRWVVALWPWAVGVLVLVPTAALLVPPLLGIDWGLIDLDVYRWGGEMLRSGGDVYGGEWPGTARVPGYTGDNLRFTYTPAAAVVFVPLSLVPLLVAEVLWIAANVVVLVWIEQRCLALAGVACRRDRWALAAVLAAVLLLAEPVSQTFMFGQINLIIVAMVLVDVSLPDGHRAKGVLIGIAAGLKLTPALFGAYYLVTGRVRAGVRASVTFAATVAAGFVLAPGPSATYWFDRAFADASRVGPPEYVGNQSLRGAVGRLLGDGPVAIGVWVALAAVVGLAMVLVVRAVRARSGELPAVVAVAIAGLLVSPIAWSHHWVWIGPALALGVAAVLRGGRRSPAVVIVLSMLVVFSAVPLVPGWIWHAPDGSGPIGAIRVVVENLYVLAGLVAVGAVVVAVARGRRGPTPTVARNG